MSNKIDKLNKEIEHYKKIRQLQDYINFTNKAIKQITNEVESFRENIPKIANYLDSLDGFQSMMEENKFEAIYFQHKVFSNLRYLRCDEVEIMWENYKNNK